MKINIEITPVESLIISQALSYMAMDNDVHETDRRLAKQLHDMIMKESGEQIRSHNQSTMCERKR